MKRAGAFIVMLVLCAACGGPETVVVESVTGSVSADGGTCRAGQVLTDGVLLATGPGAACVLRIGDGIAIRLGAKTRGIMRQHRRENRINLVTGSLAAVVRPGERLTVGAGAALVGTKGAAFFISIVAPGQCYHCVCHGRVHVVSDGFNSELTASRHAARVFSPDSHRPPEKSAVRDHDNRDLDMLAALIDYSISWGENL